MSFFSAETLGILAGVAGWLVAGVFTFIGLFSTQSKSNRADDDNIATNLINNLKSTVDQLKEDKDTMSAKLDETTRQLHLMQGRNSVLESLFNGNENSILAFLKQAPDMMAFAQENNALAKSNLEATTSLTASIDNLVKSMTLATTTTTTTIKPSAS